MAKEPTWVRPLAAVAPAACSVPAAVPIFFLGPRLYLRRSFSSVRCCWPISAMPDPREAIVCWSAQPMAHLHLHLLRPLPALLLRSHRAARQRLRRHRLRLHRAQHRSRRSDHVVFSATRRKKTSHLRVNSQVVWKAKTFTGSSCHPAKKNRGRGEIGRHAILRG